MSRAEGIDLSKWDGTYNYDVKPVHFVIQRASYSLTKDTRFDQFYPEVQKARITGAYHYFSSGVPWKQQADFFLELMEGKRFNIAALDFEQAFNYESASFAEDAGRWISYVSKNFRGNIVMWYCNNTTYVNWLKPYANWMSAWPLWFARWWWVPNPDGNPRTPDGLPWKIWQYSADRPPNYKGAEYGVSAKSIDLNVFNGTIDDMEDWLGIGDTPVPDPPAPTPGDTEAQIAHYETLDLMDELVGERRGKV